MRRYEAQKLINERREQHQHSMDYLHPERPVERMRAHIEERPVPGRPALRPAPRLQPIDWSQLPPSV